MNVGVRLVALCVVETMLSSGCGKVNTPTTGNLPTQPDSQAKEESRGPWQIKSVSLTITAPSGEGRATTQFGSLVPRYLVLAVAFQSEASRELLSGFKVLQSGSEYGSIFSAQTTSTNSTLYFDSGQYQQWKPKSRFVLAGQQYQESFTIPDAAFDR